jgi:hypothetical protein
MQATTGTRRFGFDRFNTMVVKLTVVAGLAAAVATGATMSLDDSLGIGGTSSTAAPKAHYVELAGEGRLGEAQIAVGQLQAHTALLQGEGIVGGAGSNAAAEQLQAHTAELQGEGIVGGNSVVVAQPQSFYVPEAGEGLLANPRPAAIVAHFAIGAGEGWLASGRPQAMPLAYGNQFMGEGIVGGHNTDR